MKTASILILVVLPVCAERGRSRHIKTTVISPPTVATDTANRPVKQTLPIQQARTVTVGPKDLIPVRLRIGYSTMLILPSADSLIEVSCGDKESWVVNGAENVVHIKPVREGARTNLNVISRSGKYFSFLLNEISREVTNEPDLKLFIEPKEELFVIQRPVTPLPLGSPEESERERKRLQSDLETARLRAEEVLKRQTEYPYSLRFGYKFESRAPFFVAAIFDDGSATFIRTDAREAGTLYEVQDGKRLLTRFTFRDGLYVATKVLTDGCLVIDKRSTCFSRGR